MKKKIFGFLILVILVIISTVKVNFTEDTTGYFILANIEALAANAREGVEDCDIFLYNRNEAEASEITKIQAEGGFKFFVSWNGEKVGVGMDAVIGTSVKYYYCKESDGNCCVKTWIEKEIEYL